MPEVGGSMRRSNIYLALVVLGAVVPWLYSDRFFAVHGARIDRCPGDD